MARFPDAGAVAALLDAGAEIDAFSADRETPLHVAARARPTPRDVLTLLLRRGAHLDVANSQRLSAEQLLDAPLCTVTPHVMQYRSLQCLAACIITAQRLDYERILPRRLHAFIELH